MGNFIYRSSALRKKFKPFRAAVKRLFVLHLINEERIILTGPSEEYVRNSHDGHEKVLEKRKFKYKPKEVKNIEECKNWAEATYLQRYGTLAGF